MRAGGIFERMSAVGAAAQASVPGVYAWGVTVAPAAWTRAPMDDAARMVAKVSAIAALVALAGGVLGERAWGGRARALSLWGFVLASALVWSAARTALAPLRIDAPRGIAGMLGWALFAFASAAPALRGRREEERIVGDEPLSPRRGLAGADAAYVAGGALLAAAMQLVGWRVPGPERALLVRFVAIAAGIAIVGAATDVALARHAPRTRQPRAFRLRRALATLVVLALLGLTGVLFALRD